MKKGSSSHSGGSTSGRKNSGCLYEAVFPDNSVVGKMFNQIRAEAPYGNISSNFHITTEFRPEKPHPEWYGEKVSVHVISYKNQKVKDDDGFLTGNEGFRVSMKTDNAELQDYLDSLHKNFHITGSYEKAPKYTEKIDFSDGQAMDVYIEGIFGYYSRYGTMVLK